MNQVKRSIFRKEAIEEYIHEQENQAFLKFVSPRLFICLWVILGLLSGLGVWLCFAEIPLFVSGRGMIVDKDKRNACQGQKTCFAAFFPPNVCSYLIAGKSLMIKQKDQRRWLDQPIIIVESAVLSPNEIQKSYFPKAGGMPLPNQPVAVAVCCLDLSTHPTRSDLPIDGTFEVRIDIGTRRLLSFLPLMDRFFRKSYQSERKKL